MKDEVLIQRINEYEEYIKERGIDDTVINAYAMATNTAFHGDDLEYAFKISNRCKELINEIIYNGTGGGNVESLEEYAFVHKETYSVIEKYYEVLLSESLYSLESFILYMERKREPSKRFYLPRKNTLSIVVKDLEDLANRKIKFYGLSMPSRVGKLIADYTPVLTTNGWKNHGDLVVGDYVYGLNGKPKMVQYVHPKHYANKRVWFSDNTYIDCHENHEWVLYDRPKNKIETVETKYVEETLMTKEGQKERPRWFLPIKKLIDGEYKDLKIPPYVLGAWLGDGTNRKPVVTISDKEIYEEILSCGYKCNTQHEQVGCIAYSFEGLRKDLQNYGMCMRDYATEKHIPEEYLTAHYTQRLELLAGLLDTDGCLIKGENRYHFSTISERLKEDFVSLISTFGWRVCVTKQKAKVSSSGIVGRHDVYVISFNPTIHIPCKVERKKLFKFSHPRRISVTKIEDIEPISGNCITVDDGIYRVGRRMIPTHNSTICLFFLLWIGLKRPNSHSAMGGHSGLLAKGFYKELMNFITTDEYCFQEIYQYHHPANKCLVDKSADDFTITLDKPDRFATITCRGIDGTWIGAIDVSWDGILYVDDLVRDRQHSLSARRMNETFQEYLNKMVDRKSGFDPKDGSFAGACELMVGTLWNVFDPLERIRKQYEGNPLYRFRRIPALNDKDESNFNYKYNGFTTEYYKEIRDRLDVAEWMAKYQQQPFVREGLLFPTDELSFFNGIISESGTPTTIGVCDPSVGGGDFLSFPITRYSDKWKKKYVISWVYDNRTTKYTIPKMVDKIIKYHVTEVYMEIDGVGSVVHKELKDELVRRNVVFCKVNPQHAPNKLSKEDKIKGCSDYVKDNFVFLSSELSPESEFAHDSEYTLAMSDFSMYTTEGKNEHDDAPDSITQTAMVFKPLTENGGIEAINNPMWSGGFGYYGGWK